MINIIETEEDYYRCSSCYKNKKEENQVVYVISIGLDDLHTQSFKLCGSCLNELHEKFNEKHKGIKDSGRENQFLKHEIKTLKSEIHELQTFKDHAEFILEENIYEQIEEETEAHLKLEEKLNAPELHIYLRDIRMNHGEHLKDMADKLGMKSSELSGIEHGRRPIPKGFMDEIKLLYMIGE